MNQKAIKGMNDLKGDSIVCDHTYGVNFDCDCDACDLVKVKEGSMTDRFKFCPDCGAKL